ncbi:MAG TPA: response regulator transcription factor [Paucimonas sp.]|nr:response regulator transcription factor [Paucimonas sp.]HJW54983.1 response regulator transcription factor [Burkholderiaceae bacterium]
MVDENATNEQCVFIVDDDEAMRDSLAWLLESNGLRVNIFESGEAFFNAWREDMAGCLVVDVRMPGMSGLELHERLQAMHSTLPIIFVTGHGDVPMAVSALKKGAADFIEKPFNDKEILRLIEQCLATDREQCDQRRRRADIRRRLEKLTRREQEVMHLIAAGRLNKQIADELGISIKTVEVHRARVMDKMAVRSLAELVQCVLESGEQPGN